MGQANYIMEEFSNYADWTNNLIARETIKEKDNQLALSIQLNIPPEELIKQLPRDYLRSVELIKATKKLKENYQSKLTVATYNEIINKYTADIIAKIPNQNNDTRRATVKRISSIIEDSLRVIKERMNNYISNVGGSSDTLANNYISKMKAIIPLELLPEIAFLSSWYQYIIGGVILIMLVIFGIIIILFHKNNENRRLIDRNTDHLSNLENRPLVNSPAPGISNRELEIKLRAEMNMLNDKLELITNKPKGVETIPPPTPHDSIKETEKTILYSESPEQEGWFLQKNLTTSLQHRSLYQINIDKRKNRMTFTLLFANHVTHRSAMNSARTTLYPACNYSHDPKETDLNIVSNGETIGHLQNIGDGKLKITQKINIKFQ